MQNSFYVQNESGFAIAATFGGATVLAVTAAATQRGGAQFDGATAMAATGKSAFVTAATFPGATAFVAAGRLNNAPNVFGATLLAGMTDFEATARLLIAGGTGAQFTGATALAATGALTHPEESSFTIFVDLLPAAIASVATATIKRYRARFTADGVEVPITAFRLGAPSGSLGMSLSLTLARPDVTQIAADASLKFEIGVWAGSTWAWVTMLDGGRLAGRTAQARVGVQTLQVSTLDVIGDRWSYAPAVPLTFYDPLKVDLSAKPDLRSALRDEENNPILPETTAVEGLSLHQAFERAYRDGCGFEEVRTNLPDFPITRVDFSIEGGYDAGVRPLVSIYEPEYFSNDGATLWIWNADAELPPGLVPYALTAARIVELRNTLPARTVTNALILHYLASDGDLFFDDIEQETVENGIFGSDTYTRIETTRKVRKFYNTADPTVILRELVLETKTTVYNSSLYITHRETQVDTLDALQRKTAHTRTVEAPVPDLDNDGALTLLTVHEEKCSISYKPISATKYAQDLSITKTSGLAHLDNDNQYRDEAFKLPLLDAHRNGFVDPDADQYVELRPLETRIERLRVHNDGQMDVQVIVIDELTSTTKVSSAQARVGSIALDVSRPQSKRRVRLRVPGTELDGRRIPSIDAGEVPGSIALPLAKRKLERLNNPPTEISITLPGPDFAIRRGSIINPHDASTAYGSHFVRGFEITGQAVESGDAVISQTVEARKIG